MRTFNPIRTISWIVALFASFTGVYLFTPLYQASKASNGKGPLAETLNHPALFFGFAAVLVIGACFVMWGLIKNSPAWRSSGWMMLITARIYQLVVTWLIDGFLPLSWLHMATVTLVMVTLWSTERWEIHANGKY